jgi:coenzyme F420-reducing hydrogenase gamma subunit
MTFWKKHYCPKWAEKRILSEYREAIKNVVRLRKAVNVDHMVSGCKDPDARLLRRYFYAVGEAAAIEAIMDRLFIQYDDEGRLKEFYL